MCIRDSGTAMKLGDKKNLVGTALLYFAAALLFTINPPIESVLDVLGDSATYTSIFDNLWPEGRWFDSLESTS